MIKINTKNRKPFLRYLLIALMIISSSLSWGQLLTEPFNYIPHATSGLAIQSSNAWGIVNSGDSILVESGNLSYAGFYTSTGNRVTYGGSGTDYFRSFASQTTGTVYYSFLLNISSLGGLTTTGGYTTGLIDGGTSNFVARVWLRNTSVGGTDIYNIGINAGSNNANTAWSSNSLAVGSTYLVTISYQIITGTSNNVARLWIDPAFGSEPTPDQTSTNTGASDPTSIQRVFLRQDNATNTPGTLIIDEIRTGTTWNAVVPGAVPVINSSLTANGTIGVAFTYNITATNSPTSYNATALPAGLSVDTMTGAITGIPTSVGAGNYNVSISATNASGSDSETLEITIVIGNQTISFAPLAAKTYGDAPFNLTATASSGLTVSYISSDTTVATVAGNLVTIVGAGNTTITASQGGNVNYNPAPDSSQILTVNKANQTITFNPLADKMDIDPLYVLTATASSGLIVSYVSSDTTVATVSNDTVTISAAGTTLITASQAGNANYNPASDVSQSQLVISTALLNQTITFNALDTVTYGDAPFQLTATASSGLTVTYVSSDTTVATITGDSVTIIAPGTTNITASQAGNGSYNSAPDVIQPVTALPKPLTVSGAVAQDKVYDGNTTAAITGVVLNGVVGNDIVTVNGGGNFANANVDTSINVIASLVLGGADSSKYIIIQPTGLSADITKASQVISFAALPAKTYGDAPFNLMASASSGLMVSYVSSDTLVATVSGNTVSIIAPGTTIITASQAGNGNYFPAADSSQLLTVNQSSQTISFPSIPAKTIIDPPFVLTATASSGLVVSYVSSDTLVATISGNTVTIVGAGSTVITASQSGDANYLPAASVNRTLVVGYPVLAGWDFTGLNTVATAAATTFNGSLNSSNLITRGPSAGASAGANSFRTTGFQNNGISTANTDYFQITIGVSSGQKVSLNTIDARFAGTGSFSTAPGVTSQFAYSLDGTNFTLIGSPVTSTSLTMAQISLTGIGVLQNVTSGTTVTLRYYASGQTNTGGWGFSSSALGVNGLAIGGSIAAILPPVITSSLTASATVGLPFTYNIIATNNPTSYNAIGLPAGLSVDTTTGVISGTPTTVGIGNYNVAISATNGGGTDTDTLVISISPGNQTITFGTLPAKTYNDAPFALTATSTSGLPVIYISSDTLVATINGNTVTIVGVGTTTITASQTGNANYNAAPVVNQNQVVVKANQTITFGPLPDKLSTNPPFTLNATSSSGLTVTYVSSDTLVATVSGNMVTIVGVGATTITASQAGDVNYNPANDVLQNQLVIDANAPRLEVNTLSAFGSVCVNNTTGPNTFAIQGFNLTTADVKVAPLASFIFSTNNISYSDSLSIPQPGGGFSQLIYVKFNPTVVQSYNGNIAASGGGALSKNVAALGSGINTAPTVTTGSASAITAGSATLEGSVSDTGCTAITAYGVEYSLTNGFANGTGTSVAGNNLSGGLFTVNAGGLYPNTVYYYKAFAANGGGTSYGSQQNFITSVMDTPLAIAATDIADSSFTANWFALDGASSYELDVSETSDYLSASSIAIAAWNFPAGAADSLVDVASAANTLRLISANGGTFTPFYTNTGVSGPGDFTATATGWDNGTNSKYWQIDFNATGYYNLTLSSKQVSSNTGPANFKLQYKITAGGTWTDVPSGIITVANDSAWLTGTVSNLSLPSVCNNQSSVFIRWLVTSTVAANSANPVASAGTSRIDDLFIKGRQASFVSGYQGLLVNGTSQSVTGLIPNTAYYYRVRAVSPNDTSANSNTIVAHTCAFASMITSFTLPSCNGNGDDATATVVASGGALEYGYLWSNGQTNDTIINLTPGVYVVTVTSNTGCPVTDTVNIPLIPLPSPTLYPGSDTICSGPANEFYQKVRDLGIYSAVNTGNYPYNNYPVGTTVEWVEAGITLDAQDSLPTAGNGSVFTVIVHLPEGCSDTSAPAIVSRHQLDVTPTITPANCGSSDGKIIVNVIGTAPFHYTWSTDPGGVNVIHDVQTNNASDSITGLAGGSYFLVVIDNEGNVNPGLSCNTGTVQYNVVSNNGPVVTVISHTNVSCYGYANGVVCVEPLGLTYEWTPSGGTSSCSDVLAPGTYTVLVTDGFGCVGDTTITITEPDELLITATSANASCGNTDGAGYAVATGGTQPYSYEWFDSTFTTYGLYSDTVLTLDPNLYDGTYYVVVTDANNCAQIDTVQISDGCASIVNLTAFIEGFYIPGSGGMMQSVINNADLATGGPGADLNVCDTIVVELHDQFAPFGTMIAASVQAVLGVDGTAQVIFPGITGGTYWLSVRNRTMVETVSSWPVTIGTVTSYNFTTSDTMSYGPNMREMETGKWAMYSGDIDDGFSVDGTALFGVQDGFVTSFDFLVMDVDIQNGAFGYYFDDLDGDGFVTSFDYLILDPNIQNSIFKNIPP